MPDLNISLKLVTGDSISGPGFYIFIMDHDWGLRTRSVQAATLTCCWEVRSASVCICYISNQLRFIRSRSTLTHSIYLFTHLWPPANTFLLAPGLTSYILQSLVFVFSSLHSVFKFLGSILFSGELVGVLFIHHQINDQEASSASRILEEKETTGHGKWVISKWFRHLLSFIIGIQKTSNQFPAESSVSLLAAFLVIILIFSDHQRFKGHKTENLMSTQNLSNASRNQPQDIK